MLRCERACPGRLIPQDRSLDALMGRIREAIKLCLEVKDGKVEQLEFDGVQQVTVQTCQDILLSHGNPWLWRFVRSSFREFEYRKAVVFYPDGRTTVGHSSCRRIDRL